jgi:hypothetical protein
VSNTPFPSNQSPIASVETGIIQQVWYYLLFALFNRTGGTGAPIPAQPIAVGASPFQYSAEVSGAVIVNGGTVSQIDIVRNGVAYSSGIISGPIPVVRGDVVSVTHAGAPTMTFLPSETT